MLYLTVGTNDISNKLFVPIKDKEDMYKPMGGLWLTKYDIKYQNYNEWVEYLIDNSSIFFYKNRTGNLWNQPCSVVSLSANAKIFHLDSEIKYNYLLDNYPSNIGFSYELMSKDYDGIFVDLLPLVRNSNNNNDIAKLVRQYCVSTLLLFNLNCIDYYQSGDVKIEPFDPEYYMYEGTSYNITHDKTKKRIK